MLFSTRGPLALAFAASLASATPLSAPAPVTERGLGLTTSAIVNIDLNKNWSGEALVEGYDGLGYTLSDEEMLT